MEELLEKELKENLIRNYERATNNKIYIENMNDGNTNLSVNENKSVYVWNCKNVIINLIGKCNHVFVYNSKSVTIRIQECISGLTCMKSMDCKILFSKVPLYSIEVSNSERINIRSSHYNTPIVYNGVTMNIIKSINFKVYEYYDINDGLLNNRWNVNFFNF